MMGIVGAFFAALVLRRTVTKGASSGFMMEMPKYQWPRARRADRPVSARVDFPAARGHDHSVLDDHPVGTAELSQAACGQRHLRGQLFGRGPDRQHDHPRLRADRLQRSEEHTSELQSLMRISYAVFCLKKKIKT